MLYSQLYPQGYGSDISPEEQKSILQRLQHPRNTVEKLQAYLLKHPGEYIPLEVHGDSIGVSVEGDFCESGKIFRPKSTTMPSLKGTIKSYSLNAGGFGYVHPDEPKESERYQDMGRKKNSFFNLLQKIAQEGSLGTFQDIPYDEELFSSAANLGLTLIAHRTDIQKKEDGTVIRRPTCLLTVLPGLVSDFSTLGVVPHYQSTYMAPQEDGTKVRQSLPAAWSLNYKKDDAVTPILEPLSVFSTLVVRAKLGQKDCTIGNTYVAPPSNPIERSKSIIASLEAIQSKKMQEAGSINFLSGDLNAYGLDKITNRKIDAFSRVSESQITNDTVRGAVNTILSLGDKVFGGKESYPWMFLRSMSFGRMNIGEIERIERKAKQVDFSLLNNSKVPTFKKWGGLFSLALDGVFTDKNTKGSTETRSVDWTSHKILETTLSSKES